MEPLRDEDPREIGPYTLLARAGESATTRQYLARDAAGRTATLQVPHARLMGSTAFRKRFRAEAELAGRLTGGWTVPVLDVGPDPDEPWLATAYVPGVPLGTAVGAHGPLPELTVRCLGAALAETLAVLHTGLGGAHRGLAPHTVLLTADGPRLSGFGPLAAASAATVAEGGRPALTLDFLTPEQVRGAAPGPASDIFVLGMLLVYAATGRGPFPDGGDPARGVADAPPDLGAVPPRLRPLLARCLEKDPALRPTAEVVAAGLAPGGAAALLREDDGWLPAALVTRVAAEAAEVMALDGPDEGAGTGLLPAVPPPAPPRPAHPPKTAAAGRQALRPATRRQLLAGALAGVAGLTAGAAGAWTLKGDEKPAAAPPKRRRKRVTGTPPPALWHYRIDKSDHDGLFAEPVVWQDRILLLPVAGAVIGLDLRTGRPAWQQPLFTLGARPVLIDGGLAVFPTQRGLAQLVMADGTVRFTDPAYAATTPARVLEVGEFLGTDGTRVWLTATVSKARARKYNGPFLICYDAVARREVWRAALPPGYPGADGAKGVTGAVQPGQVLVRREQPDGVAGEGASEFAAFRRDTGKPVWRRPLGRVMAFHEAWAVPDGRVYANVDRLRAYDATTGKELWVGEGANSVGVVLPRDDTVYTSGTSYVHALDARTGKQRWQSKDMREADAGGLLAGVTLFADPAGRTLLTGDSQSVTALAAEDGEVLWKFVGVSEKFTSAWSGVALRDRVVLWQGLDVYALSLE
ncbi:serine/threonine-protein kinase [Streptomyces sp. NPDC045431]|uniref:serine/threonine-protein kinase n=1 Tax=Streptomyces sp. NPDC045431 TaxID=3155613 RepID=UPI0034071093